MKILILLLLIPFACPAQSLSLQEKHNLVDTLIQCSQCFEQLENCEDYSRTQEAAIYQLTEKVSNLTYGFDQSKLVTDSLFTDNYSLRLDLNKTKERSYRKTNALVISIAICLIEGFIITQK